MLPGMIHYPAQKFDGHECLYTTKDENVGHVFNVTTLNRNATSVTYKVESIFEADNIIYCSGK